MFAVFDRDCARPPECLQSRKENYVDIGGRFNPGWEPNRRPFLSAPAPAPPSTAVAFTFFPTKKRLKLLVRHIQPIQQPAYRLLTSRNVLRCSREGYERASHHLRSIRRLKYGSASPEAHPLGALASHIGNDFEEFYCGAVLSKNTTGVCGSSPATSTSMLCSCYVCLFARSSLQVWRPSMVLVSQRGSWMAAVAEPHRFVAGNLLFTGVPWWWGSRLLEERAGHLCVCCATVVRV